MKFRQKNPRKHVKKKGTHEHVYVEIPTASVGVIVEHGQVRFWVYYQCQGKEYRGPDGKCNRTVEAVKR
jgi:hypothetical protein